MGRLVLNGKSYTGDESNGHLYGEDPPRAEQGVEGSMYIQYTATKEEDEEGHIIKVPDAIVAVYSKIDGQWMIFNDTEVPETHYYSWVIPNPQGGAIASLTKVNIDGSIYSIDAAGSEVIPNKQGTPSHDLDQVEIDGVLYLIRGLGTPVEANPQDTASTNLSKIKIDGTAYNVVGTEVEANPSGTATTDLTKLNVDGTIYSIPEGGTEVEANPAGAATATLGKLGVDDTIYSIPVGSTVVANPSSGTAVGTLTRLDVDGDIYNIDTGSGGSEVEGNPSGAATVILHKLGIDGTIYSVDGSGSEVEPNPAGEATDVLNKLGVDGTIYSVGGGGGGDLPANWTASNRYLRGTTDSDEYNDYGWLAGNTTYYTEDQVSWRHGTFNGGRSQSGPCLYATVHTSGWSHSVVVSTNREATYFTYNTQGVEIEHDGHTWYYSGGSDSQAGTSSGSGISNFPNEYESIEAAVRALIDYSEIEYVDNMDEFSQIMTPNSGYLFAGGGKNADLSDATFKVTNTGDIIANAFTGATDQADGKGGLVPAPETGDETKFLCGDGTWAEVGGNVDDVYVNGTSVLDSNKIAQITSYREVTQAEYDALPASKESDNVLYCIKDKATADTTVAPIIYSEEEQEVGVWTDGKPLYQKSFSGTTLTSGNATSIMSASNIDSIIGVSGYVNDGTSQYCIPYRDGGDYMSAYRTSSDVFTNYSNYFRGKNFILTLQYTKTTDQPGSGKYAPSGVPAVHYSENEQVVGTWMDGKPIYEKTYVFSSPIILTVNTWTSLTGLTVNDIDTPISAELRDNRSVIMAVKIDMKDDPVSVFTSQENTTTTVYSATIRYTKQTS